MSLLSVKGLTKVYGERPLFQDLCFEVDASDLLAVKGPSGCGKTTLLRCLALLETFEAGMIEFNDELVAARGFRRRPPYSNRLPIAMVFQEFHLWRHLSVLENIALPLRLRGRPDAEQSAYRALGELGLEQLAGVYPATLSTGQRQRVAFVRAAVHRPSLLLLDEVTSHLDAMAATLLLDHIAALRRDGTAVILATHTQHQAGAETGTIEFARNADAQLGLTARHEVYNVRVTAD